MLDCRSQWTVVSDYVVLGWESGKQRQGEQTSRSFSANEQSSGQPDIPETCSLQKASMVSGWRESSAVKSR